MTSPGRISFFITLGIAAIDMLTCAFIATVVMFLMFLTPRDSSQATALAPQDVLMIHWVFPGARGALFGLQIGPPGTTCLIWSDEEAEKIQDRCVGLSKTTIAGTVRVLKSGARSLRDPTQDGALAVAEPVAGTWTVNVIYADTADRAITVGKSIVATVAIVAKEVAVVNVPLQPGQERPILDAADSNAAGSLKAMFDIN